MAPISEKINYIPGKGFQKIGNEKKKVKKINWLHVGFLIGLPVAAVIGSFFTELRFKTFLLAVITYFCAGFGITGGYHRLWSHKAWDCVLPVKLVILIFGAAAMEGSCLWWSLKHRAHHKFTDTNKDPYNVRKGFWYAHFGWMMFIQDRSEVGTANVDDLKADPWVMWQHRNYLKISLLSSIAVPTLLAGLGWGDFQGGLVYASLCRIIFVHHATFCVNSLAHYLGDQAYSDFHSAFDSVITALVTLGEGYHNYHHEFPQDYRNGIKWYHYDPTKWTIHGLYTLGLAHNLKWISDNEITKAKYQMKKWELVEAEKVASHGSHLSHNLPLFSIKDVHDNVENGIELLILSGRVYDVSEFMDLHPGGRKTLEKHLGMDATEIFRGETGDHIHTPYAESILSRYLIGRLQTNEE